MDSLEHRVAALEAELSEMKAKLALIHEPTPRARPLPIADAIARVTIVYAHNCGPHTARFHKHRCVYLLVHNGVVTYVGRSRIGYGVRYEDHQGKPHDTVRIFDLVIGTGVRAETAFESLEAALISHFTPSFNIAALPSLAEPASLWPTANAAVWNRIVALTS